MNLIKRTFLLAAIGLSAQVAFAGNLDVALNAGDAIPLGNNSHTLGQSAAVSLQVYHSVTEWISAGAEAGYMGPAPIGGSLNSEYGPIDADGDGHPDNLRFSTDDHLNVAYFTPGFKVGKVMRAGKYRWKPYAGVAGGFYFGQSNDATVTLHGTSSGGVVYPGAVGSRVVAVIPTLNTDPNRQGQGVTRYMGGFNSGVGVECYLSDHLRMGIDLRYHQALISGFADYQAFIPSLHLGWEF